MSSTELYYSYERTRTSVTAALCKKLKDLMAEFQALRMRLADEHRYAIPSMLHDCVCYMKYVFWSHDPTVQKHTHCMSARCNVGPQVTIPANWPW